jgi:anti-anti-sigma factor
MQKIKNVTVILVDLERATTIVAESLKNNVQSEIASDSNKFIFDLTECEFIDSTFLSALVTSYKRIVEHGGELKIVGLKPSVDSMFKLTRLSKIFDIYSDAQDALNSFNKR